MLAAALAAIAVAAFVAWLIGRSVQGPIRPGAPALQAVKLRRDSAGWADVDLVGESFYQANIAPLAAPQQARDRRHEALVLYEPDNPVDPLAILVTIDRKPVGHLSRDDAAVYRAALAAAGCSGRPATCRAYVTPVGPHGMAGVKLELAWPPEVEPG